tara:strand:- start:287 stop:490 length:204 start_codon:yes stop_codon:yes gene_type:complete
MSHQVRLEALKLAVGVGEDQESILAIARSFAAYISGETLAPTLKIVETEAEEPTVGNRRQRRAKGRK